MAGIGFELKKLFQKNGIFALLRAYGYAGAVCAGPMLLGIALLLGVHYISGTVGLDRMGQNMLTCMITYSLLSSMIITNSFGMITTRYTADCLYEGKPHMVMPSFYGSISLMMTVGGLLYGLFLFMTDIPVVYGLLNYILFEELIIVWTEMNYLTAIKDYKGILLAFLVSLVMGLAAGYILTCVFHFEVKLTLLSCVCATYEVMAIWYYVLLLGYFPAGEGNRLKFLKWLWKYPSLFFCGLFVSIGMFAHILLMWGSDIGVRIHGLYYMAPQYDVPALAAFLSTLITTINFVTSVEVNFYPKYRTYYSLFNDEGVLADILQAEKEMRITLQDELSYTATKQVFVTIIFIVLGTIVLPLLPLGFNEEMLGIFRVLCLGYAFYAIGNSIMLMSLYFADNKGACFSAMVFALGSVAATLFIMRLPVRYYGFGFVAGAALFTITAALRLWYYQRRIRFYVLCSQPLVEKKRRWRPDRIANHCMNR